jgi:hypothetical protein
MRADEKTKKNIFIRLIKKKKIKPHKKLFSVNIRTLSLSLSRCGCITKILSKTNLKKKKKNANFKCFKIDFFIQITLFVAFNY